MRASVRAASLAACSARCHEAAYCNTFSYTADTASSSPNCLLSALLRAELSVSGDLVSAPSWAVYRYHDPAILCHVMSRYVTLCHAVQPRPWPGLQLLQRGRAGASSAAVPPRGEAGRGVLHVRGQVRHKYLHIYISTYLQLRGRDTRTAADLQHCSSLCHQAPYCRSFTYKWVAALHSDRLTPAPPQDQLLPGHQQLLPVGAGGGGGAAAGPAAGLGVDAVRGAGRPRLRTRRRRRGQVARTLQLPPSPQCDYHITNLVH